MPHNSLQVLQAQVADYAEGLALQLPEGTLRETFRACFMSTIDTTVQLTDDLPFLITGDIPAMWLRDSASQLTHYLPFLKESEALCALVRGIVQRHAHCVCNDPYVNAFNESANGRKGDDGDLTEDNPLAWERKYEVDSLCSTIHLAHAYWKASDDSTVFDDTVHRALRTILDVWKTEQHHTACSPYRFERHDCPPTDTLTHEGRGAPVAYTGMTWSGFRPSDDACTYGYLIPANMFAVVELGHLEEIARTVYKDAALAQDAALLAAEIDAGIQAHGIVEHLAFGKIYAFETDGMGNHLIMDDANVPSLLAIPFLGYRPADDEIYQNTRRFALSHHNPYFFEGAELHGIGSPHTQHDFAWPIALCIQALTSTDADETRRIIEILCSTTTGTNLMHESVCVYDTQQFSRPWFAWANSLFAHMICEKYIAPSAAEGAVWKR